MRSVCCFFQDGVISDMTRTVDMIVAASRLPISVVIIGVGGADFTNMVILNYVFVYRMYSRIFSQGANFSRILTICYENKNCENFC